jgi:hypothetical protein
MRFGDGNKERGTKKNKINVSKKQINVPEGHTASIFNPDGEDSSFWCNVGTYLRVHIA